MPDVGLMNAVRELTNAMRGMGVGGKGDASSPHYGALTPGGPQGFDPEFFKGFNENFKDMNDEMSKHNRDFKKSNEEFNHRMASLTAIMAPVVEGVNQFMKWTVFRPAELMGGGEGRAVRAGLERASGAGNIGFDIAAAIAAVTGNLGLAAGIQLVGRAGLATKVGQLAYGEEGLAKRGFEQNIVEDFGRKKMDTETAAMFNVRTGRLGAQAGAWGAGFQVPEIIKGLVGDLNENPQVLQQAIANAFQVGGTAGIKNISRENIAKLVREGYGDAGAMMAIQATAGRYGYGQGAVPDMANRTGLAPGEVLPLMQQTRMQYFMYGKGTAESINKFVANTSIGAINPTMGLAAASQAAQGAAGVTDEAASMLQYREFLKANPGSTYLDFVEAKKNGFADEKWRRFVGGAAASFAAMGQTGRLIGAGTGLGTPGQIAGLARTYAEGLGPDVYRTGARIPSDFEGAASQLGKQSETALYLSLEGAQKVLKDFAGFMDDFAENIAKAGLKVTAVGQAVAEFAATSKATPGILPEGVSVSEMYGPFWDALMGRTDGTTRKK